MKPLFNPYSEGALGIGAMRNFYDVNQDQMSSRCTNI